MGDRWEGDGQPYRCATDRRDEVTPSHAAYAEEKSLSHGAAASPDAQRTARRPGGMIVGLDHLVEQADERPAILHAEGSEYALLRPHDSRFNRFQKRLTLARRNRHLARSSAAVMRRFTSFFASRRSMTLPRVAGSNATIAESWVAALLPSVRSRRGAGWLRRS
jgi:hypothetical protein